MSLTKEINVVERVYTTKRETERQRKAGFIPGVVYGHGAKPFSFFLKSNEFIKTINEIGTTGFLDLKSDNKNLNGKTVIVKDLQYHVVRDDIIHVDLQLVKKGEELKVSVPINFTGTANGVKMGGLLQTSTNELNIACLPKDMPKKIAIDISALEIGDSISVKDIAAPKGVKILDNEEEVVVSVIVAKEMSVEVENEEVETEVTSEVKPEEESTEE